MTTTELIELLKNNENGGITGRPRVLSITLEDETFIAEPDISICSSGDGICGPELDLKISGGRIYKEDKEKEGKWICDGQKWIYDGQSFAAGYHWCHCSVCGKKEILAAAERAKYCQNCGAKMSME